MILLYISIFFLLISALCIVISWITIIWALILHLKKDVDLVVGRDYIFKSLILTFIGFIIGIPFGLVYLLI